jgi:hypothetical protein
MTDDDPPFTLANAWEDLRYVVSMIVSVFGGPAQIAAQQMLLARTRQEILVWLAPIEALARRVLLLAALAAPVSNLPLERRKAAPPVENAFRDTPYQDLSDNPADWRVLFNDWPKTGGKGRRSVRTMRTPSPGFNAYPLARRLEALLRLADDPGAAIRRMAAKLAQRRALVATAFAPYRHKGGPVQPRLEEVQAQVDAALWNTS